MWLRQGAGPAATGAIPGQGQRRRACVRAVATALKATGELGTSRMRPSEVKLTRFRGEEVIPLAEKNIEIGKGLWIAEPRESDVWRRPLNEKSRSMGNESQ